MREKFLTFNIGRNAFGRTNIDEILLLNELNDLLAFRSSFTPAQ